jgi:hypothetical protein
MQDAGLKQNANTTGLGVNNLQQGEVKNGVWKIAHSRCMGLRVNP